MTMFSELLSAISRLSATITNRQAASERTIIAAVNSAAWEQRDLSTDLAKALSDSAAKAFDLLRSEQAEQTELLKKILTAVTLPPAVKAVLTFEVEGKTINEGEHIDMKVAMNLTGLLTVALLNAAGGRGQVDGVPTWKAAPEGVVALTPAADGMSCQVTTLPLAAGAPASSTVITFDADADLGDGVKDLVATAAITVFDPANDAVTAEITAGAFTPVVQG